MRMGVLHVTTTKKPPFRSKVKINSTLLTDIGFIHGAPIIATPLLNGFNLTLQSMNSTDNHGKLIHVGLNRRKPTLTLNFANNFPITTTGLSTGDYLAAGYEYGVVTAKKLPPAQKYYVITKQNYGAFLQLSGAWLSEIGFMPGVIATVAARPGSITLRVWVDTTLTYSEMVKFARANQYQIIQVQKNQQITIIDLGGYLLDRAGFESGNITGVCYEYGTISLFKPDLSQLGGVLALPTTYLL